MPTTFSKFDDDSSTATPIAGFSPKKPRLSPELQVKISYQVVDNSEAHSLHLNLLQIISATDEKGIKIMNKRSETLKPTVLPALNNKEVYANHFDMHYQYRGAKDSRRITVHVIQKFQGIQNEYEIKKVNKVMDFLKDNNIQVKTHLWKSEEWSTVVLGFFTKIFPRYTPQDQAVKMAQKMFNIQNKKKSQMPLFRMKEINVTTKTPTGKISVKVYGIEVKTYDAKRGSEAIRQMAQPTDFVLFQMKKVNEKAFNNAVRFASKLKSNTQVIMMNNVTEGAFFKLEERIKAEVGHEMVYHLPDYEKVKILTNKNAFESKIKELKGKMQQWIKLLEDNQYDEENLPSVAYIARDDISDDSGSYLSVSIAPFLSIDISELSDTQKSTKETQTITTPSELTNPKMQDSSTSDYNKEVASQIESYRQELRDCYSKIEHLTDLVTRLIEMKTHEGEKHDKKDVEDIKQKRKE